jgi:hypothetical protein
MLAHDRRVLDVPLEERLQSRTSELLAWAKTMLPIINRSVRDARAQLQTGHQDLRSYFPQQATVATGPQSRNADSPRSITNRSSRPPQLFLLSSSGHHGPHSSHADSNEPSSSKRAPPGHPAALSERTNQDGHALLRNSPVFPRYRRQYHLNPLDINIQSCTRIDKPQSRSRDYTCRRSGSNLSYIGIDAAGLQNKFYYYWHSPLKRKTAKLVRQ